MRHEGGGIRNGKVENYRRGGAKERLQEGKRINMNANVVEKHKKRQEEEEVSE